MKFLKFWLITILWIIAIPLCLVLAGYLLLCFIEFEIVPIPIESINWRNFRIGLCTFLFMTWYISVLLFDDEYDY